MKAGRAIKRASKQMERGDALRLTDDWRGAAASYEKAAALLEEARDPANPEEARELALFRGRAHYQAGVNHSLSLEEDRAEAHLLRALTFAEQLGHESPEVGSVCLELGPIYQNRGDLERAEEYAERALEVIEPLAPESPEVTSLLYLLGVIQFSRGDLDRAQRTLGRTLDRTIGSTEAATVLGPIAASYLELGDFAQALRHAERALKLHEEAEQPLDAARDLQILSVIHLERGDPGDLEQAETYAERALDTRLQAMSDPRLSSHAGALRRGLAPMLLSLGKIAYRRGDLDEASARFSRALDVLEPSAPESQLVAEALEELGLVHRTRGELDEAVETLRRAVMAAESLRARAGRTASAREGLFALYQNPFQELIAALAQRDGKGDAEAAFAYAEGSRARAMVELLAERQIEVRAENDEQRGLLEEERSLQWRLANAYNRLAAARQDPDQAGHVAELEAQESQLEGDLEGLRERMRRAFPAYADIEYPDPLDVGGAQALLGKLEGETLLLEYDATGAETFLWALRQDEFEMLPLGIGGERLEELVEAAVGPYRRAEDTTAEAADARAELSRLLLEVVPEPFWEGAKRLLVVPDGALHYLPFEILPAPGEGEETLVERHPIAYAPSATALGSIIGDERPRTVDRDFVGFGDPRFDGGAADGKDEEEGEAERRFASLGVGLAPLRATRKEVEGIARGFAGGAPTYLGEEATEYAAKHETEGARFVHFSTHGLLDDKNPLYSGLALSPPRDWELAEDEGLDDCLQVYEMFGLRLSAEAVVCSACQTGLGTIHAGEGLVGMSRALFFAGARCVVLSLWPVPNVLTARLMERFYSELQKEEPPPLAEALQEAKLAVRERYPDPFNWAAFVAVGVGW